MDRQEKIHNLPVPERFLPLMTKTLAEAYAAETTATDRGYNTPSISCKEETVKDHEWTEEEVARAYRESTTVQKEILDYLADRPGQAVSSLELARAVYSEYSDNEAEGKVFGSLGGFGTRTAQRYGKSVWFFKVDRERNPDGTTGRMLYTMPEDRAAQLRRASGRE